MDTFLRGVLGNKITFWQQLTTTIYDFKPKATGVLSKLPEDTNLVCFHGKPRIFQVVESSLSLQWVEEYVNQESFKLPTEKKKVTIIIPYNIDRGFLTDAIKSVPEDVQLIVSQGDGNWPQNFNKALPQAEGRYIKYLHEDDMLTPNCIEDSVRAIEEQGVDFIHGNAIEFSQQTGTKAIWKPSNLYPTLSELITKNTIHSATTMYRREVFNKVGLFNETEQVRSFEELEFNIRCLQMGMKIGYCNSTLAFYRRHPNQLIKTTDKEKRTKNRKDVIDNFKKDV
jgi:GT2 family glycosyltransferase